MKTKNKDDEKTKEINVNVFILTKCRILQYICLILQTVMMKSWYLVHYVQCNVIANDAETSTKRHRWYLIYNKIKTSYIKYTILPLKVVAVVFDLVSGLKISFKIWNFYTVILNSFCHSIQNFMNFNKKGMFYTSF